MFPILIRSRNRPEYLHITLKSLSASNLLDGQIIIVDDCSDNELSNQYLYTNKKLILPTISWENQVLSNKNKKNNDLEIFRKYFYDLPIINNEVRGIKDKFTVISPQEQLGVKNCLLWVILTGFKLYPLAKYIVVLEDDLLFNKDWLKIADQIYNETINSEHQGLITVYNRASDKIDNNSLYFKIKNISGQMYLIPRFIFDLLLKEKIFNQRFTPENNLSSDVYLYTFVLNHGLNLLNSSSSYIQHIGVKSICREGRFLRYSKNFLRPYAWNKNFDN